MLERILECHRYFRLCNDPFEAVIKSRMLFYYPAFESLFDSLFSHVMEQNGLILLLGEHGVGKSAVMQRLRDQLYFEHCLVLPTTYPRQPLALAQLTFDRLLSLCCLEAAIHNPGQERLGALTDALAARADARGTAALLIDDAQDLPESVLAEIPLLVGLRHRDRPVLQIVLAGTPELEARLRSADWLPEVEATIQCMRLNCLERRHVGPYIEHRLRTAGYLGEGLFSPEAVARIADISGGLPLRINRLCEAALLITCAKALPQVTAETVEQAAGQDAGPSSAAEAKWAGRTTATAPEPEIAETVLMQPVLHRGRGRAPFGGPGPAQPGGSPGDGSGPNPQLPCTESARPPDCPLGELGRMAPPPQGRPTHRAAAMAGLALAVVGVTAIGVWAVRDEGSDGPGRLIAADPRRPEPFWLPLADQRLQADDPAPLSLPPAQHPLPPAHATDVPADASEGSGHQESPADADAANTAAAGRPADPPAVPEMAHAADADAAAGDTATANDRVPPPRLASSPAEAKGGPDETISASSSPSGVPPARPAGGAGRAASMLATRADVTQTMAGPGSPAAITQAPASAAASPPLREPPAVDAAAARGPRGTALTPQHGAPMPPVAGATVPEPAAPMTPEPPIRVAAVAAEEPPVGVSFRPAAPAAVSPVLDRMIAQGDSLLATGDVVSARLLYERAAAQGNARAMIMAARTYDPLFATGATGHGLNTDPTKAIDWYRQAVEAGDPEAAVPMQRLSHWLKR